MKEEKKYYCNICKRDITEGVFKYSTTNFQKPLCYKHQREYKEFLLRDKNVAPTSIKDWINADDNSWDSWIKELELKKEPEQHIVKLEKSKRFLHTQIAEARKENPRAYESWKEDEVELLIKEFNEGKEISHIAQVLQRKPSAIRSRLRKLGLEPNKNEIEKQEYSIVNNIKESREKYPKAFTKWTDEEDKLLIEEYSKNKDLIHLSNVLQRSPKSIQIHLFDKGVIIPPIESIKNYCTNCGTKIEEDYNFCGFCGKPLKPINIGEKKNG